jgi:hypothetical protein
VRSVELRNPTVIGVKTGNLRPRDWHFELLRDHSFGSIEIGSLAYTSSQPAGTQLLDWWYRRVLLPCRRQEGTGTGTRPWSSCRSDGTRTRSIEGRGPTVCTGTGNFLSFIFHLDQVFDQGLHLGVVRDPIAHINKPSSSTIHS